MLFCNHYKAKGVPCLFSEVLVEDSFWELRLAHECAILLLLRSLLIPLWELKWSESTTLPWILQGVQLLAIQIYSIVLATLVLQVIR